MLYQTITGKTIEIPTALFITLTDDEFAREIEELVGYEFGNEINDVWHQSVLKGEKKESNPEDLDLTELDSFIKLDDLDITMD